MAGIINTVVDQEANMIATLLIGNCLTHLP